MTPPVAAGSAAVELTRVADGSPCSEIALHAPSGIAPASSDASAAESTGGLTAESLASTTAVASGDPVASTGATESTGAPASLESVATVTSLAASSLPSNVDESSGKEASAPPPEEDAWK